MYTTARSLLFGSFLLATPAVAVADDGIAATAPAPGVHEHDGFYLRFGTGFGGYSETITAEDADEGSVVTGMANVGEFAIGWSVRPGWIVGVGAWSSSVLSSDEDVRGMEPPSEVLGGGGNFSFVGPFFDHYFHPQRGLHLQASAGFATVRGFDVPDAQDSGDEVSLGGGFMVGFGYEWWVSDQWSLGVLGRLAAVVAVQDDDTGMQWTHAIGTSPSVLFTATYD
jgi:hypothetical protein